jgi:hypothetical protein
MLQLMRPAWPGWGLLGDDWLTGLHESGRRVQWPAARAMPQHAALYDRTGSDASLRRL